MGALHFLLFLTSLFLIKQPHRCSLWLSTAGGARENAGNKIVYFSTQSSICSTKGKVEDNTVQSPFIVAFKKMYTIHTSVSWL